jgi:hypothetical protein
MPKSINGSQLNSPPLRATALLKQDSLHGTNFRESFGVIFIKKMRVLYLHGAYARRQGRKCEFHQFLEIFSE